MRKCKRTANCSAAFYRSGGGEGAGNVGTMTGDDGGGGGNPGDEIGAGGGTTGTNGALGDVPWINAPCGMQTPPYGATLSG